MMKRTIMIMLALLLVIPSMTMTGSGSQRGEPLISYHDAVATITVTNHEGAAVENAKVQFKNVRSYHSSPLYTTNASGMVDITITASNWGLCSVRLLIDSVAHDYQEFEAGPDDRISIHLRSGKALSNINTVRGTVKDRLTGSVLSGIQVNVKGYSVYETYFDQGTTSGLDGSYIVMVPNATDPLTIETQATSEYRMYRSYGRLDPIDQDLDHDILLLPVLPQNVNALNIRYVNSTTGQVYTSGETSFYGYMDGFDHGRYYTYSTWSGASDGWRTYELGMGEYEIYTYLDADPVYKIHISSRSNLVMNSSDVTLEVPVANPQMAPVDILIRNSSGPLQSAYVYYGCELHRDQGTTRIGSDRNTNATGRVRVFVPVGIPVTLEANANGHHDKLIDIMAPNTDPMDLEITLVERMTGAATTPVRFTVIDVITSIPLPDVYLDGNGLSGGSYEYFYTRTNATGQATVNIVPGDYEIDAYSNLGRKDLRMKIDTSTTEVEIVLDRYMKNPEKVNASFYVIDPQGNPVPGVRLSMNSKDPYYIYTYTSSALSDEDGRVEIHIYPGTYRVYIDDSYPDISYRSVWRVPDQTMLHIPITGLAENVTVYPGKPLERISGKTYDSLGDPLGQVEIYSMSVHDLKRPRLNPLTFEWLRDQVYLYGMWDGGSVNDGYFRSWGVDHTYIAFYKDGYKPVFREVHQNTRGHDDLIIVMDEDDLTRFNISGRVVDASGNGVTGIIVASDPDRGGAHLDYDETMNDGSFSMRTYPGSIRLTFTNYSVIDTWDIDVDADVTDLVLTIDPESYLDVLVEDEEGNPVEGANVRLMEGGEVVASSGSGGDGSLFFDIPAGDYHLAVARSELYDAYEGDVFFMNGIDDMTMTIILLPRTEADVSGTVTADGGPLDGVPIVDAIVRIYRGSEMFETNTNESGGYLFHDILHGTIRITASPPEALSYAYGRSGYLDIDSGDMLLGGIILLRDIGLEFREWEDVGTFNVTYYSPTGTDVPINAPIVITFSSPVDVTELAANVVISPLPGNVSLIMYEAGKRAVIDHDLFEPMTEYEVVVLQTLSSADGEVLWNLSEVRWSFTTGSEAATWALYTKDVALDDGKNLSASVTGMAGITVFMVIDGIGSFEMGESESGAYNVIVPGDDFEWNTTYSYWFSDASGGIDMAPLLSGSFRTPPKPGTPPVLPEWSIDSVIVTVDKDGSWKVWAQGEPGIDVYIVIDGVGSFPLTETSPGIYEATIPGSNFEKGRTYNYHLSDTSGGEAKTAVFTAKVPAEGEIDGPRSKWGWFVCGGCGIVLLLLLVILVLIIVTRRSGKRIDEE